MYLRSIAVKGFKSFADRTILSFEPGISVIVGPNGSGKSNVADAVLWVLGEQSARSLRGGKMEDVIFAGSASRQPLGMAEVSLSVDNTSRSIALEYDEVVITRQIYRSGESEYLLNNTPCRLVDIQEMLSDLGVGKELTAVIGQGRLEAVIGSRPEDRRAYLEEAAGLLKHRRRKDKALRKLAATEQNLLRVHDIMGEVRKQLRPLERQARVAEEYRALERRLRELGIRIVVKELDGLQTDWRGRQEDQDRQREELTGAQRWLAESRDRLRALEESAAAARHRIEELRGGEYRMLATVQRLEAEINLCREKARLYEALRARPPADVEELRNQASQITAALEEATHALNALERQWQASREERRTLSSSLKEARTVQSATAAEASKLQERKALEAQSIESIRENLERARAKESEALAEGERAAPLRQAVGDEFREATRISQELKAREGSLSMAVDQLYGAVELARTDWQGVAEMRHEAERREAQTLSRLQAIQEMSLAKEDYMAAASRVVGMGDRISGVHGILVDLVEIEPEWERAIGSYLGSWLFSVVVRDVRDAVKAIRELKQDREGFAIFLPLMELELVAREARRAGAPEGELLASSVVSCKTESARAAVDLLLRGVVLTRSLEEAARKSEEFGEFDFVTPDGDVIAPGRVVKGGAATRSSREVLNRQREIERLQETLEALDEESERLALLESASRDRLTGLEQELKDKREELGMLEPRLQEAQKAAAALGKRSSELDSDLERREAAIREIGVEIARLLSERESHRVSLQELESESVALETRSRDSAGILDAREREMAAFASREDQLKEKLVAQREREHNLRERDDELRQRLAEWEKPVQGAESVAGKLEALDRLIGALSELLAISRDETTLAKSRREEQEAVLADGERDSVELRQRMTEAEEKLETMRESLHRWELEATELKLKVDALVQRLLDDYQVSLEKAFAEHLVPEPLGEMRRELRQLEERRQVLGPVNLLAEQEFEALNARHHFLEEQVDDLKESKASLAKVIRAIDREIARIFTETYEEVNRHFQELFALLFPNGRAELSLTDPDDLLNSGVEIQAQPHGKRVRKLSLLSGGEMALTSLAFLFAIFKARPSPFYFLDEVEAALDDVNLHRFLNMLRQFEKDSQLVIITHQKRTMEIADVLYGISMQADGVSRAVSLRLEREAGLAGVSA